jgi:hypothetical protein
MARAAYRNFHQAEAATHKNIFYFDPCQLKIYVVIETLCDRLPTLVNLASNLASKFAREVNNKLFLGMAPLFMSDVM